VKGAPPRALVVDDDAAVRRVAVRTLERLGWTVHAVEDGDVALAHLTSSLDPPQYDLILCDIRMPRMGGIELYAQLVVLRAEVLSHLVLYSGTLQDEEVTQFLSRTAVRTLPKPFAISDLVALAEEIRAR
jgi:CheY-like chemotaxis protein